MLLLLTVLCAGALTASAQSHILAGYGTAKVAHPSGHKLINPQWEHLLATACHLT